MGCKSSLLDAVEYMQSDEHSLDLLSMAELQHMADLQQVLVTALQLAGTIAFPEVAAGKLLCTLYEATGSHCSAVLDAAPVAHPSTLVG